MSDFERLRRLLAGLDAKAAEKDAAEAAEKERTLLIERWKEHVRNEPREAIDLVLREARVTEFFNEIGREFFGGQSEVVTTDLVFNPERITHDFVGENFKGTVNHDVAYWEKHIYLFTKDSQAMVSFNLYTAPVRFPVSAAVGYRIGGRYNREKKRLKGTIKDKTRFFGNCFWVSDHARLVRNTGRGWLEDRRDIHWSISCSSQMFPESQIDFSDLRKGVEEDTEGVVYEIMVGLRGVKP